MNITAEALRELLNYDPATGIFTWKIQRGRARAGDIAGCLARNSFGYEWFQIRLLTKLYPAHRLAWLHYYGEWPKAQIDHLNQNPKDNRIANLRDVEHSINLKNQPMKSTNTSGVTGVYWDERNGKWCADVKVNYVKHHLGRYEDIEDAARAVKAFRDSMGFTSIHGVAKKLQEA